jgi:branched-chain amino acid transport system substrate-binding protein
MHGGWRKWLVVGVVATLVTGAAGTAVSSTDSESRATKDPVKVGIIYSRTGGLSAFGAEYIQGFKLGLRYATKGTNTVNGHKLDITYIDDGTDAAKAVAAGKDLIGQGYKILAGSTSSGVAAQMAPLADQNNVLLISGAAAADAITGINRHTFRAGRQTFQDAQAMAGIIPPASAGKKIVVFAEDTAFGKSTVSAVESIYGGRAHRISSILVPFNSNDLTPFAQQLKNAGADMVYVAWAGPNSLQMWQSLQQQGVPKGTTVATGVANRATYDSFGPLATGFKLLQHYVYSGPKKNAVNAWLVKMMRKKGQIPDLFTPDGFVTAQMIVRAVQKADGDNVDKMISALEGYRFLAPKGPQRIRPEDHAMIQPMFVVKLVKQKNGHYASVPLKTVSPGNVQPPITKRF